MNKMHFSVPDTQELVDEAGNAYLGYNIHINGLFHCTVRYKQLHNLHEQLLKELDVQLPNFPPKKLFPLTLNQKEERRLTLDKYIQSIGQNSTINSSELLNGFLLNAQLETAGNAINSEDVIVWLMNGTKLDLEIKGTENTNQLLDKIFQHLKLEDKYHAYFSLFIIHEDGNNFIILRKLQNFEAPAITQLNLNKNNTKIVLGKWYWDIGFDNELLQDPVATDLLYVQSIAEVNRGWIKTSKETYLRLEGFKNDCKKQNYVELIRSLKYYGCIQFTPCICDYPESRSKVLVAIGRNELNVRVISSTAEEHELSFKVTRMRCWRITTLHEGNEKTEDPGSCNLELSFEYLMSKDNLQWVTIASDQAILMSVCLQSMIDELLFKSVGGNRYKAISGKSWTYVNRNGQSQIIRSSLSSENLNNGSSDDNMADDKNETIIKKFAERFFVSKNKKVSPAKTVMNRENKHSNEGDLLENNAFCMIGDDDL